MTVTCLNSFLVFITSESLCICKLLSHDSMKVDSFVVYGNGKLTDVIDTISWVFNLWENAANTATKPSLTGNLYK